MTDLAKKLKARAEEMAECMHPDDKVMAEEEEAYLLAFGAEVLMALAHEEYASPDRSAVYWTLKKLADELEGE